MSQITKINGIPITNTSVSAVTWNYSANTITVSNTNGVNNSVYINEFSGLTIYGSLTYPNGATNGYVLTSDANGNASWQPPTGGSSSGSTYSQTNNYSAGTPVTITHNLNTTSVLVQIIDTVTNELIDGFVSNYTLTSVDVTLSTSLNDIKVVVAGGTFYNTGTDYYVTGGTYSNGTLTLDRQNGYVIITGFTSMSSGGTDTYVTGFTYNDSNKLTISQNGGQPDLNLFINSVTGLTVNGDITFNEGNILNPNYIQFNPNYTGNTIVEGRMYWDEPNGTVSLGMHGSQVLQQIGLEYYYYVKNQSGSTIQNGKVVRAVGTLGSSGRILGEYMIADGTIPPNYTLGVATEDILNGDDGYVTEFGLVRGFNTTGSEYGEVWSDGDILWVSSKYNGGLTNVKPSVPDLNIEMAIVVKADANGSIFVRPHRFPYSHDLQDFGWSGGTENNLDIIQWDSSVGYFKLTNTPSFNSISASTYLNLPIDPDNYVTGGTYSNGVLTLNRQNGTVTVSGLLSADTFVTGFTNNNGILSISQNGGQPTLTADTTQIRSVSFNSNDMALNTATRSTLTPLVIAVTRFNGTGVIDDAGLSFVVPQDYLSNPEFYFTWRASTSSVNTAKIFLDIYTGDTNDLGSLTTIIETTSITDTPTTANVFLYSPTVTPTTPLKGNDTVHLRIYRDPGDAGDTFNGDLDMINFVFRYKSKG